MKKYLFFIAFLATMLIPARAQLLQMGLKLQYSTASIDEMVSSVKDEYQNFSTDFLRGCEAGLLLRINVGRWITIQPEANFSIGSVWDTVDAQTDFISAAMSTFENVQTVNLSIPVLAAVRLVELEKLLSVRLFAGPEFYTNIKNVSSEGVDFAKYSLVFGAGIDLLGAIYVDGRITKPSGGEMTYSLGVGLIF